METLGLTVKTSDPEITVASTAAHKRTAPPRPRVLVWRLMGPRRRSKQSRLESNVEKKVEPKEEVSRSAVEDINKDEKLTDEQKEKDEQPESVDERKEEVSGSGYANAEHVEEKNKAEKLTDEQKEKDEHPGCVDERKEEVSGSADVNAEPVEDINKAQKLTNSFAANAGVPPSLFSCGLNAGQIATGYAQSEIQVPIDMVVSIVGEDGECIRDICDITRTRIELLQPNPSDIEQSKDWIVRITGGKEEMEAGRQLVKDVMDVAKEDIMKGEIAPLSSGFSQQPTKPPQSYSQWYKAKFGNHAPQQHNGPQPTPYAQGDPTTHSGHGPPQDQYGKPRPQGPPPHAQPNGQQPRPNQTVEAQTYGRSMPPPQQKYPNPPSGHVQQTYHNPFAPVSGGYGQIYSFYPPRAGYGQQAFPLAGPTGGYGLFPAPFGFLAPVYPAAFGAPSQLCCCLSPATAACAAQPTQAHQPGYDQSGGYDGCSSRSSIER